MALAVTNDNAQIKVSDKTRTRVVRIFFMARKASLTIQLTADLAGSLPSHCGIPSFFSFSTFFPNESTPPFRIEDGKVFFVGKCFLNRSLMCAYSGFAA